MVQTVHFKLWKKTRTCITFTHENVELEVIAQAATLCTD